MTRAELDARVLELQNLNRANQERIWRLENVYNAYRAAKDRADEVFENKVRKILGAGK